jgi:hypothetical protein
MKGEKDMYGLNYRRKQNGFISSNDQKSAKHSAIIIIFIMLTLFSTSLVLPLLLLTSPITVAVSWLVCLFSIVALILLVKRLRVLILCGIVMLVLVTFTGSPVLPSLIFGSVISVGAGAALLLSSKGVKLIPCFILPALSLWISYLATGNLIASVSSLCVYIPLATLWMSGKINMKRTSCIAMCGGVLVLITICLIGDLIYSLYGKLNFQTVALAASRFSDTAVLLFKYSLDTFGEIEVTKAMLGEARAAADTLINLSFGIVSAICLVFAYLAQSTELCALEALGNGDIATENARTITASIPAATIFILAHLISFATDASSKISFAATVAMNIYIMLAPLFICTGIKTAIALPKKRVFAGILLFLALIIITFVIPSAFITVIAFVGAFGVMIAQLDAWAKEHYGKGGNNE